LFLSVDLYFHPEPFRSFKMKTSQTLALLSSIALGSADFLAPARGQTLEIDEEFTARWETDGLVEPIDISLVPVGNENAAQQVAGK